MCSRSRGQIKAGGPDWPSNNGVRTKFLLGHCTFAQGDPSWWSSCSSFPTVVLHAHVTFLFQRTRHHGRCELWGWHNKERVDKDALVRANLLAVSGFDAWASAAAALTADWQASNRGSNLGERTLASSVIQKLMVPRSDRKGTVTDWLISLLRMSVFCSSVSGMRQEVAL